MPSSCGQRGVVRDLSPAEWDEIAAVPFDESAFTAALELGERSGEAG